MRAKGVADSFTALQCCPIVKPGALDLTVWGSMSFFYHAASDAGVKFLVVFGIRV